MKTKKQFRKVKRPLPQTEYQRGKQEIAGLAFAMIGLLLVITLLMFTAPINERMLYLITSIEILYVIIFSIIYLLEFGDSEVYWEEIE